MHAIVINYPKKTMVLIHIKRHFRALLMTNVHYNTVIGKKIIRQKYQKDNLVIINIH